MRIEDKDYKPITECPQELLNSPRGLAIKWLLKHGDKLERAYFPGGKSLWRAYFDDGVYKGGWWFKWKQSELTPLNVYITCAQTGWPGLKLNWLEEKAAKRMMGNFPDQQT